MSGRDSGKGAVREGRERRCNAKPLTRRRAEHAHPPPTTLLYLVDAYAGGRGEVRAVQRDHIKSVLGRDKRAVAGTEVGEAGVGGCYERGVCGAPTPRGALRRRCGGRGGQRRDGGAQAHDPRDSHQGRHDASTK